jgi:hypothetical protein
MDEDIQSIALTSKEVSQSVVVITRPTQCKFSSLFFPLILDLLAGFSNNGDLSSSIQR